MIEKDVPIAEAEKMVAKGARILEHRRDDNYDHVCLVEVPDAPAAPKAEAEGPPKKRGRPKSSGK